MALQWLRADLGKEMRTGGAFDDSALRVIMVARRAAPRWQTDHRKPMTEHRTGMRSVPDRGLAIGYLDGTADVGALFEEASRLRDEGHDRTVGWRLIDFVCCWRRVMC